MTHPAAAQVREATPADALRPENPRRLIPKPVQIERMDRLSVTTLGRRLDPPGGAQSPQGGCQEQSTHTDADFGGGSFLAQAGFAEGEIAAATYELQPSDFPIRIDSIEMIFVTVNAIEQTTTHWSVLIWEGEPDTGRLVAEFSSDGVTLPHLVAGPGTTGTNIQLTVDPNDPEQIFIFNDSGTNTFSVGYRIDQRNAPSNSPCAIPPAENRNAFPATDTGPLAAPFGNWLFGLNCGPLGCPPNGGWTTFGGLNQLCRPSGDWVIRATWTRTDCQPGVGACCKPDGTCEVTLVDECDAIGGIYQGDGSACDDPGVDCPEPTGACCNPAGGCLGDLTVGECDGFGGDWAGPGTDCEDADADGTADDCEGGCPADLTGPGGDGVPNGELSADDFFFYLALFADADPDADLTGPGGDGVPNGELSADDFFFYLALFAEGCG